MDRCVVAAVLTISLCYLIEARELYAEKRFKSWRLALGRNYSSAVAEKFRFQIFKRNLELINGLNRDYQADGIVYEENQFADVDPFEFRARYLMPTREPVNFQAIKPFPSVGRSSNLLLPSSFDWKGKGKVTTVRDQGSAGTCWAFSAVQNIEGQWAMKGMNLTELSVEQVVDCDGMEDVSNKKADCGVFGGWPYLAYQYVQKQGGIASENNYPYCCGLEGDKGTCYVCPAPEYNKTLCGPPVEYCKPSDSCHAKLDPSKFMKGLKVSGWSSFSQNETTIAQHLMEVGPLSVAMNAASLQFYRSGIYSPLSCDPKALDHAVLLTGFGHKTTLGVKREFWIVKNSWGTKWGEDGYFRIIRGKGKCGINTQVTTAHLS